MKEKNMNKSYILLVLRIRWFQNTPMKQDTFLFRSMSIHGLLALLLKIHEANCQTFFYLLINITLIFQISFSYFSLATKFMEKRGPIRGYRDTGYLGKKMIGIRDIWAKNLSDTGCLKKGSRISKIKVLIF